MAVNRKDWLNHDISKVEEALKKEKCPFPHYLKLRKHQHFPGEQGKKCLLHVRLAITFIKYTQRLQNIVCIVYLQVMCVIN